VRAFGATFVRICSHEASGLPTAGDRVYFFWVADDVGGAAEIPPEDGCRELGGCMGEIEELDVPTAAELAARLRTANWTIARAAVSALGDGWDLDETQYEFMCECARPGCQWTVMLSLAEYVEAQAKGYDVVVPGHEDARDLVVRRAPAHRVVARARSTSNGGLQPVGSLVADWTCGCGQEYRVAARGSRILLWPRNSRHGFRGDPVADVCVNGCAIDGVEVVRAVAGRRRPQTAASL
jgi:hypothetical protein